MKVWLNGAFVEDTDAKTSVFDAGFQHGVGLFETMCAKNGRVFRAQSHMERLAESAAMLRLTENLQTAPLVEALQLTLDKNNQQEARMRITITGGDLNMLQQTGESGGGDPTIIIQTQPPTKYPDGFYNNGVMVSIAGGRVNPYDFSAGHKTLNYWSRLLNLQMAAMQQCGESLWLTPSATVAGGSVSNIFIVQDGELCTPAARGEEEIDSEPSAVLPGITRDVVFEIAKELGVGVQKKDLAFDDVLGADEVFLTNSSWGVLPVIGVRTTVQTEEGAGTQDQKIGDAKVGKLTKQLHISYQDTVGRETLSA
jgi:branched-subunit amino acid aminotransferase/4-amino-4-deoxychorismate lyase